MKVRSIPTCEIGYGCLLESAALWKENIPGKVQTLRAFIRSCFFYQLILEKSESEDKPFKFLYSLQLRKFNVNM